MTPKPQYRSLRGMPDILSEDAAAMRWIENVAREVFKIFGYKEIRTPLLESTEVFTRSIGEDTDIVEKEMYSFLDRGGKNISLRPEGTASVIRAYIEHGWNNTEDITKLYYSGAMFRGERPQKGRLRQFHQIGAEIIGGSDPYIDAEIICSLNALLSRLGIEEFTILVNSLGCTKDRTDYKKALANHLKKKDSGLCDNCKRRSHTNVLRVLDCKKKECKDVVENAQGILEYLCEGCLGDYELLKNILSGLGVAFCEKEDLVRGLDYYTGTIFEVVHSSLGAQDAIAAGGRYDNLTKQMGGPDVGATGYALGMERLLLAIDRSNFKSDTPGVLVMPLDEECYTETFRAVNELRLKGVACNADLSGRSFKRQMRKANKEKRAFVIIIGEDEIKSGKVVLKDMETGEQEALSIDDVVKKLGRAMDARRKEKNDKNT